MSRVGHLPRLFRHWPAMQNTTTFSWCLLARCCCTALSTPFASPTTTVKPFSMMLSSRRFTSLLSFDNRREPPMKTFVMAFYVRFRVRRYRGVTRGARGVTEVSDIYSLHLPL